VSKRKKLIFIGHLTCFRCSFPSFVGVAADKDAPKDAEIPAQRKDGNKPEA
jgi:hypothetical protein